MKKKIGIVTINDDNNYGNRLQNYALQKYLENLNFEVLTLKNNSTLNSKEKYFLRLIKYFKIKTFDYLKMNKKRLLNFKKFNYNINFSKKLYSIFKHPNKEEFNYFITGSDQVWNPYGARLRDIDLLCFADNTQKISYAASIGANKIPKSKEEYLNKNLSSFKSISVREERGKEIIQKLTSRNDIEVLIDPTMLLSAEDWDKVAKKPIMLNTDKYILNYFLGTLSEERKKEIELIANLNNCQIIDILDKNSPFYECGPSEFLYLEKNAFLICTDSFHSSVFAIIYDRPFVIFDRNVKKESMNSRIETLLNKFKLKNREYNGKNITKENLIHDYTEAYEILEKEIEKSMKFLKKSLDMEE